MKQRILQDDPTLAGSILRLTFHDAVVRSIASDPTVGGADGSIRYELDWSENRGLKKPLTVVEEIYELQKDRYDSSFSGKDIGQQCHILSFADTLALSAAAVVEAAKGPAISIRLDRKDVESADKRLLDRAIESESKGQR